MNVFVHFRSFGHYIEFLKVNYWISIFNIHPYKWGYWLRSTVVVNGEQIFAKQSAVILRLPLFPFKDNWTISQHCLVKCSSPNLFKLRVSVFIGTRPSLFFNKLVIYDRWLPLSRRTRTGIGLEPFIAWAYVTAVCKRTLCLVLVVVVVDWSGSSIAIDVLVLFSQTCNFVSGTSSTSFFFWWWNIWWFRSVMSTMTASTILLWVTLGTAMTLPQTCKASIVSSWNLFVIIHTRYSVARCRKVKFLAINTLDWFSMSLLSS